MDSNKKPFDYETSNKKEINEKFGNMNFPQKL